MADERRILAVSVLFPLLSAPAAATPPRRVTSPTWDPPPPCKQALTRVKCPGIALGMGRFGIDWYISREDFLRIVCGMNVSRFRDAVA